MDLILHDLFFFFYRIFSVGPQNIFKNISLYNYKEKWSSRL